jgi:hypothetical protein
VLQFSATLGAARARSAGGALFAAAALAASLAFATPSAAAEVFIYSATPTDVQIGQTDPVILDAHPDRAFFGMSPQIVHAKEGSQFGAGQDFTVLAFCIDFYTDTPTNWNADFTLNTVDYQYHDGVLGGAALGPDPDAETKVSTLINYGTDLWFTQAHNAMLQVRLAAVQGAIWQIMTGKTFVFHPALSPDPAWNQLIQDYADLHGLPGTVSQSQIRALFSDDGGAQAIAYALRTSVPEPETWALMLVGFFGAGSLLRKSRRRVPAAG